MEKGKIYVSLKEKSIMFRFAGKNDDGLLLGDIIIYGDRHIKTVNAGVDKYNLFIIDDEYTEDDVREATKDETEKFYKDIEIHNKGIKYHNIEMIKHILQQGAKRFSYKKKDGSYREAYGTLNSDMIKEKCPMSDNITSKKQNYNPDIIRYFDLDSDGWRSFLYDNFIDFKQK